MTETRYPNQQDIENDIVRYADKLRAGLLDHDPELKARVEAAVAATPASVELWQSIRTELEQSSLHDSSIGHQLRARRREVIQNARRGEPGRPSWPHLAAAFGAVLVAATVLLFSQQLLRPSGPDAERVALTNAPELEQLKENLEFYAWLDDQNAPPTRPR